MPRSRARRRSARRRWPLYAAVVAALAIGTAAADIYTYTDDEGVVHFTNLKPKGRGWKKLIAEKPRKGTKAAAERGACKGCDAVPAADVPADIKGACEAMRGAYDQFVQKRLASNKDELEKWKVMGRYDLDKASETCLADNQPKVAACQKNAFAEATAEIGRDRADSLLATCSKKFGLPIAAAPGQAGKAQG